jgi:hypothetical protein
MRRDKGIQRETQQHPTQGKWLENGKKGKNTKGLT